MAVVELRSQKASWRPLRWLVSIERAFNLVAAGVQFILIIMICSDAFMRAVFNSPILGVYELSRTVLVVMVFLALAYVQSQNEHIKVPVVFSRLPPRIQAILNVITLTLSLGVFFVITWQGVRVAWEALQAGEYAAELFRMPLWPVKSMIPLGTGLLCIRFIIDISHQLAYLFRRPSMPGTGEEG